MVKKFIIDVRIFGSISYWVRINNWSMMFIFEAVRI